MQDESQRPSSACLGPEKGRWTPTAWSDVVEAAAGGLLDESHWVDLKQELPTGKRTHSTELAQDLASLAVDGGLLAVYGMQEVRDWKRLWRRAADGQQPTAVGSSTTAGKA